MKTITVEFRFRLKVPAGLAEGHADMLLKDLKELLRKRKLPSDARFSSAFDLCAVIKPSELDREFGAQDKYRHGAGWDS